jgi:hypothetical protein
MSSLGHFRCALSNEQNPDLLTCCRVPETMDPGDGPTVWKVFLDMFRTGTGYR